VLWKYLYNATEVTVAVNTPRAEVVELASELNVTSKRVVQWITNRKRNLKPDLFRKATFEACGVSGLLPRRSRKRTYPSEPKQVRLKPYRADESFRGLPKQLNFNDTELPNLEPENSVESSLNELWTPCNAAPLAKKIKTEKQNSTMSRVMRRTIW